jgi:hypothetical protein
MPWGLLIKFNLNKTNLIIKASIEKMLAFFIYKNKNEKGKIIMYTRKTTAEKIAEVQKRKEQIKNEIKLLQKRERTEEREERDKRYYRRGKHIESLVSGADSMTDEKFYKIIEKALNKHFPTKRADIALAPSGADEGKDEEGVTELE